jgi:hypothetical protein
MDGASFYFIPLPWFIDLGSRLMGINVYGVEGFYIPYFYNGGSRGREDHPTCRVVVHV